MAKNIATGALVVKEGPTSKNVLTYVFKDDIFVELEKSIDGRWLKVLTTEGKEGWIAVSRWFKPVPQEEEDQVQDPPWLKIALDELKQGVAQFPDPEENPRIVEYLKTTSLPAEMAESDETHWCSAFVNWCFEQAGIKGTGSPGAKSWLSFGDRISTPRRGCVVVFDRPPDPASGHVAFYIGEQLGNKKNKGSIAVLGGNQGDRINIQPYPKARLRGFFWPRMEG
jgi:uncharacterized protein (TIGR02594 family)